MRFSAGAAANLVAWAVVLLLVLAAVLVANRLGFAGLTLLGSSTWLVCNMARLDQDTPTWGVEVFKARMNRPGSPENRAAAAADRDALLSPLRFYERCGMALTAIGVAGFAWQVWRG